MLDKLIVRNFKVFEEVEIDLAETVVFVGPNNTGKTSALQALALWDLGVKRWHERRGPTPAATRRSAVTINRRDLPAIPVPEANLLWRNLHVRKATKPRKTENIRIEVEVCGVGAGVFWSCGMEFDYANPESIYCRPLGWARGDIRNATPIPPGALDVNVVYLPPMSGLASSEARLDPGAVQVRLGEGRTAEVLRNLCHTLYEDGKGHAWETLLRHVRDLFGVHLHAPRYIPERGELAMSYADHTGATLDISVAGRGMQQTTLLLAFLLGNPGSVLLLDEPDAHLEILRQRQIYNAMTAVARKSDAQIVAATHSEVILREAADRDVVVAFVGKPHRIDDRGSQVRKALERIGYEDYFLAQLTGWVLYLEGSTDLEILRAFAATLDHPAAGVLERPFVHPVRNQPNKAREHFYGLREAKHDLVGLLLTDRLERKDVGDEHLRVVQWRKREIENYLMFPAVLERYAESLATGKGPGPLFEQREAKRYVEHMRACVKARIPPAALENPDDRWWNDVKASDDFLDPVFEAFFESLGLPNRMRKTHYHRVAAFVQPGEVGAEVRAVLDAIQEIASRAAPVGGPATPA